MTDPLVDLVGVDSPQMAMFAPPEDPLVAFLREIGGAIPAIPSDYAELRALQSLIRDPMATDERPARADDMPGPAGGALGLPSIVGQAPGSQNQAALGVLAALFYGKTNLLVDPMFYQPGLSNPIPITTPAPSAKAEWQAHYTKTSGTAPTGRQWASSQLAADTSNPSNSRTAQVTTSGWGGAGVVDFFIRSKTAVSVSSGVPFLLAAARMIPGAGNVTGITSMTVAIEIVDGSGTILATSAALDWLAFNSSTSSRQLVASLGSPSGTYYWRMHIAIVSGAGTSGSTAPGVTVAEPQLTLSQIQTPAPFAPIIGGWTPNHLTYVDDPNLSDNAVDLYGISDSQARFVIDSLGDILWGSGAATADVFLSRSAAGTLKQTANGASQDTEHAIDATSGRKSKLSVRVANEANPRVLLEGDATQAALQLGPGGGTAPDTRIYRSAAKTLTLDDGAGGLLTKLALLGAALLELGGDFTLSRTAANKASVGSGDTLAIGSGATLDATGGTVVLPAGQNPPFIACGTGSLNMGGAATATTSISFGHTFSGTPNVQIVAAADNGAPKVHFRTSAITTTGATAEGATGDGTTSAATIAFNWLAVENTGTT